MTLGPTIFVAIREIRRHLLRSILTTLGIVIGVSAVVTLVTLGNGATAAVQEQISKLGSNVLTVRPGQAVGRGDGPSAAPFDLEDVDLIRSQVAGVLAVAPQATMATTAIRNAANWSTSVNGTTAEYLVAQQWQLESGRTFAAAEELAGKAVCIIGSTVRSNLFRHEDAIAQRFRLGDVSCEVIGVLSARGQTGPGGDQDDTVIMPIKAVQRRLTGSRDITSIMIAVDPSYESETVQASLKALLRERRGVRPGEEDNFNIFDTKQIAQTLGNVTGILTAVMGAVAAVSLIVGGIGIMNIMLVSVTERTREIGIRLAIGAVASEVLLQFLVESVVLACLGGLIGLVLAFVMTTFAASMLGLPFLFDVQINAIAFGFSALIGVVFGYFPAWRAANLNPIDALRHE